MPAAGTSPGRTSPPEFLCLAAPTTSPLRRADPPPPHPGSPGGDVGSVGLAGGDPEPEPEAGSAGSSFPRRQVGVQVFAPRDLAGRSR